MRLASILTLIGLALPTVALGFSLNIDPPTMKIKGEPGSTVTRFIRVENTSNKPIKVSIYYQDWRYTTNLEKEFLSPGDSAESLSDNLSLFNDKIVLKPNEVQSIFLKVAIPENGSAQHGVVFFETEPTDTKQKGGTVKLIGRVGSLIFAESEDHQQKTVDFSVAKASAVTDMPLNVAFINTSVGHIKPEPTLLLVAKDSAKTVIESLKLPQFGLFNGESWRYTFKPKKRLKPGTYELIATLQLEDQTLFNVVEVEVK